MALVQRIKREIQSMKKNSIPGIQCCLKDEEKMNMFEASILGPSETPYEGGVFQLQIQLPDKYPFAPPHINFQTPIYHPNIDSGGRICLDVLKMPPKGTWSPHISLENVLISIQQLIGYPNPDDPLVVEIAEEYKNDLALFHSKARESTLKHAFQSQGVVEKDKTVIDVGNTTSKIATETGLQSHQEEGDSAN